MTRGIYGYFTEEGNCIYIGQSEDIERRSFAHKNYSWYKDNLYPTILLEVPPEYNLLDIEAWFIFAFNPISNNVRARPKKYGKEYNYLDSLGFDFNSPSSSAFP